MTMPSAILFVALALLAGSAQARPAHATHARMLAANSTGGNHTNSTNTTHGNLTAAQDVLLVHGFFTDASIWSLVISRLQKANLTVHAVQLTSGSLQEDVTIIQRKIQAIGKPVVLAAHSYGGFPASIAAINHSNAPNATNITATNSTAHSNVTALVFFSAFLPTVNETMEDLLFGFPPVSKGFQSPYLMFDQYGWATESVQGWIKYFGVSETEAKLLAVVQKPFYSYIFNTNSSITPAWASIPTYAQVSKHDKLLPLGLATFMANRTQPLELVVLPNAGHLAIVSQPAEAAKLIIRAAAAKPKAVAKP